MSYGIEPLPGRVGNLTPVQQESLRKLWRAIFQVYGLHPEINGSPADAVQSFDQQFIAELTTQERKRFSMFPKQDSARSIVAAELSEDDTHGPTKKLHAALARYGPELIREAVWNTVKHEHPDALALRFLRARKWDVDGALVMMISAMLWRHIEMKVDLDVMTSGEGGAIADEQGASGDAKKVVGRDFMSQVREGKSFLHGIDRQGRPICLVRVRLHKQGEQCEESLQRHVVFIIETARMMLIPPVDTATIIFDMTGFSMANMDYNTIKFVIKCFEANFPESLGAVLVHRSPWIFQGIWKVIRGWLDPVVASKVQFTNNKRDLEAFIEPGRILKELGGEEMWNYQYKEPLAGENDLMTDCETRDRHLQKREALVTEFEAATVQWIHVVDDQTEHELAARRADLADKLRVNYWRLDPYIRARSLYDRLGILRGGVEPNWYPT